MRLEALLTARTVGYSNRHSTIKSHCLITSTRNVVTLPARSPGATRWAELSPRDWFSCTPSVLPAPCPCAECLPVVSAPGTRRSIAPLHSTSSWRGISCPLSIFLIPRVPSVRPSQYWERHRQLPRARRASPWPQPWQTFPAGLTRPRLSPPAPTSPPRSRINSSGKARLTLLSPFLPVPNSRLVLGATPRGTPVSTTASNWEIRPLTTKSWPPTNYLP